MTVMKVACDMQEIQKTTCSSCGTTFVAENATTFCPLCASNQEHHHIGAANLCPFFII